MQVPSREADANVRTKAPSTKCEDEASTTSVPKMVPVKEDFFDVKEDIELGSPGSGNGTPAQGGQSSVLENKRPHEPEQSQETERPHGPEVLTPSHDIQDNLPQVPWADVMNEQRSVQQSCGQLRTQVESIESNMDASHIVAGQESPSRRPSMPEDDALAERDASMREQQRVTEISNKSGPMRLTNRMRIQEWYYELSDQDSDAEINHGIGAAAEHTAETRCSAGSGTHY